MTLDVVETEFLAALVAHEVRFVVIGGHAVNYCGVARPVRDLDVVIDYAPDNAARVIDALASLREGGVTLAQLRQPHQQVRIGRRGCEVLTSVSVPFEDLLRGSEPIKVGGMVIHVVSNPHLRRLKQDAGRPIDLVDYEALGENSDAG